MDTFLISIYFRGIRKKILTLNDLLQVYLKLVGKACEGTRYILFVMYLTEIASYSNLLFELYLIP